MARPRSELHEILKGITPKVYFQPPGNTKMTYPCIVYARDTIDVQYADNSPYRHAKRYSVTVIDRDPDTSLVDEVSKLPLTAHNRYFAADDLNHDVFTLYF